MVKENEKYLNIITKFFRVIVTLVLVLIPWVIFPFSLEFYESGKAAFFIFSTSILAILFVIKIIIKKNITISTAPLDIVVLIWVILNIIATILSVDPTTSVWGYLSSFTGGLFLTIFFAVFYFIVVNSIESKEDYEIPIKGLIFSIIVFSLFLIIQYINGYVGMLDPLYNIVSGHLGYINAGFLTKNSFSPMGSSALISFVTLIFFPIIANNYFTRDSKISLVGTLVSVISISIAASSLLGPIKLVVPLIFIIILAVYIFFYSNKLREIIPKVLLVSLIFIISFLFFNLDIKNNFGIKNYEVNPLLEISQTYKITAKSVQGSFRHAVIGTGPDTFIYDFSKNKDINFNTSQFWNLRYSRGGSEVIEIVHNLGFLGLISIALVSGFILYFISKKVLLSKVKDTKVDVEMLGIAILPIILVICSFVIYFNFILWFIFWVSTTLVIGGFGYLNPEVGRKFEVDFSKDGNSGYIISQLLLSISIVIVSVISFILIKDFYFEIKLRESLNFSKKAAVAHQLKEYKSECILYKNAYTAANIAYKKIGYKDYVARNYSLISFHYGSFLFNLEKDKTLKTICSEPKTSIYYLVRAEAALKGSSEGKYPGAMVLGSHNVENFEASVKVFSSYIDMFPLKTQKYSKDTITATLKAISLDPHNPNHWLNIGIILYSAASNVENSNINLSYDYAELANQYFNRAYELKPDYLRTILIITQANLLYGRSSEAIDFLNLADSKFNSNSDEYKKIQEWKLSIGKKGSRENIFKNKGVKDKGLKISSNFQKINSNNSITINKNIYDNIKNLTK